MTSDEFIERLRRYYVHPDHKQWIDNIQKSVARTENYIENHFWDNHFKHFHYNNGGSIEYEAYSKFHQGMWHLHVANFLLDNGYNLVEPSGNNDIVATKSSTKIFVECVCPGWGDENNPIRQTFREMSNGFTEIGQLNNNFVYKVLQHSIKDKEKQIKERKQKNPGIYLSAVNEGLLVNGFRSWNQMDTKDRFEKITNGIDSVDEMIYGCVFEGEYCHPKRGLMLGKVV